MMPDYIKAKIVNTLLNSKCRSCIGRNKTVNDGSECGKLTIKKVTLGNRGRGRPAGSSFNSYFTKL